MTRQRPALPGKARLAISYLSTITAGALIMWLAVVYSISLLSLYLGLGIWRHTATIALAAIPVWSLLALNNDFRGKIWLGLLPALTAASVLALSYLFAGSFMDVSWDGTAYHQQAILHLVDGWPDFPARPSASLMYHSQLDHYPKAMWVMAASLYQATGNLEAAKLLNFVLLASGLLMLMGALARLPEVPLWVAALVAVTAAMNPVAIYQSLSFYVDGLLGSLLVATIGLILLIPQERRRQHLVLLAALIILAVNIKQTGILYVGCLVIALLVILYVYNRDRLLPVLTTAVLAGVLACAVYGYSPYVTNTINFGNPLYPILVQGYDFEKGHRPPEFDERSGIDRLFRSTFSKPTVVPSDPAVLQTPFSLAQKMNIAKFRGADIRLGGWGVLFSGALTLSFLALPLLWLVSGKPRLIGLILFLAIVSSVLVNPEAWWARFAPQWYLSPLIIGSLLLLGRQRLATLMGFAIVFVLLVNSSLVAYTYYPYQYAATSYWRDYMQKIVGVGMPIYVHFGDFPSNRIRLQEAGIQFEEVGAADRLTCENPHRIFAFQGLFCVFGER